MYGVVYKVTNTVNGHFYIGQTKTRFSARWSKHCQDARNGAGWVMAAAIRKYGPEAFTHEIVEACEDRDSLNAAEVKHIVALCPHYNAMGGGGQLGSPSAEVRAKISRSGKGKKRSAEAIANMRAAQKGHYVNPQTTEKAQAVMAHNRALKKAYEILSGREIEPKAARVHVYKSPHKELFVEKNALTKGERISIALKAHHAANPDKVRGSNNPMFGRQVAMSTKQIYTDIFSGEGNPFFGMVHTEDTRAKMRAAHAARAPVECPHCGKIGHLNTMKRWHFDNCRSTA